MLRKNNCQLRTQKQANISPNNESKNKGIKNKQKLREFNSRSSREKMLEDIL